MYVGSTVERGLHELVYAVVGTPDGGVRVTDDGPGIPVEAAGARVVVPALKPC
ncbi:hypothetical protein ACFYYS_27490 [Streptomyces sp. NPDC002120]|uniref:hypothetical protein n=1 Tax=Streptomyces sp. NPDC002120 TaxID=3364631 RepID=UPI0036CFD6F0